MRAKLIVIGLVVAGWLPMAPAVAGAPVPAVVGDFDGDRHSDLALWQPADGSWAYRSRDDRSGDPSWSFGHGLHGSASDIVAVARDYDGDRRTDSALYRRSTGSWSILRARAAHPWPGRSSSATPETSPCRPTTTGRTGRPGRVPPVRRDLASAPQPGRFQVVPFGTTTDRPAPGDYDGDGYADLAVFRSTTGAWIVLRSSDQVVTYQTWGCPDDKLVPADYDGNGTTDPAVYRSAPDGAGGADGGRWMIADTKADVLFGRPGQLPMPGN